MKNYLRRRIYISGIYLFMSVLGLMIVTQTAFAQFKKGDRFLGGSFRVHDRSTRNGAGEYKKEAGLGISPLYGKFLTDKLALGISLSYGFGIQNTYQENQYPEKSFYQRYKPGILLRRYFSLGKMMGFVLDGNLNYQLYKYHNSYFYMNRNFISNSVMESINVTVSPAFVFFPTPSLGFEISPGRFNYYFDLPRGGFSSHSFQLVYAGLNWGLNYYFRKKENNIPKTTPMD